MKVRDLIALIEADGGVLARTKGSHQQFHHPTKPGTVTIAVVAAETRAEALTLIREAIQFHIQGLKEDGQPVPRPSSTGEVIDVHAA